MQRIKKNNCEKHIKLVWKNTLKRCFKLRDYNCIKKGQSF